MTPIRRRCSRRRPLRKVGFGRIIRDEDGNVVDIIIDEEPEQDDAQDQGGGAEGASAGERRMW